jgi:hypothetical protein
MGTTALECPFCQAGLLIPDESAWHTCQECGRSLQVHPQLAFARGREQFLAAQETWAGARSRKEKSQWLRQESAALDLYKRAHSALEEAFRFTLADDQRRHGVEMMADLTRLFASRGLVSSMEAAYWGQLAVEQNILREHAALRATLAQPAPHGLLGLPRRWHRQLRYRQLTRALARLDKQIRTLEEMIAFVDQPRARAPR